MDDIAGTQGLSRTEPNDGAEPSIEEAAACFEAWRSTHKPRARVPEDLWEIATVIARKIGVKATADALGVNYYSLRKHLSPCRGRKAEGRNTSPEFIEIAAPGFSSSPPECSIELENPAGAKMRVTVRGASIPDLDSLFRGFWGAGR